MKHTYRKLLLRKVAYTRYDVLCFVDQTDFTRDSWVKNQKLLAVKFTLLCKTLVISPRNFLFFYGFSYNHEWGRYRPMPNTAKKRWDCGEVNSSRSGCAISVTLIKFRVGQQKEGGCYICLQWTLQRRIVARRLNVERKNVELSIRVLVEVTLPALRLRERETPRKFQSG